MPIRIELRCVPLGPSLEARIQKRLAGELARVRANPVAARVTFADENGPKGGRAIHCALTVQVSRRPTVRVEEVAETAWLAFDRSFDRLRRRLAADQEQRLKQARYPKKQFAAKRLLMEGLSPDTEA